MSKYIEELKVLNYLYDVFNKKYFEDKLKMPVITIQSNIKSFGHFTAYESWKLGEKETSQEINISAENLKRPLMDICGTLIHEMTHQYCYINKIVDTSRNGHYHNKLFKDIAETKGLLITYMDKIGWSVTEPTEDLKEYIKTLNIEDIKIFRIPIIKEVKSKKTSSTHRMVCPCCDLKIRVTKENLKLRCEECDVLLEYID